ncbi:MAG: hypothetical protein M1832_001839 [Thelocarpon impressellum]|nr:MAG: hypothetical protein M1832_001839 [Thelocarpon impressellum]
MAAPISTSTTATDSAPAVELDGSPIHPTAPSAEPGADVDEYEALSGEVGAGAQRKEERDKVQAEKSKDPAVLVNIPALPAAQDYEVAAHTQEGAPAEASAVTEAAGATT